MSPTSGIEFLVWLLIAPAIIAMLAKRLRIPYTVAVPQDRHIITEGSQRDLCRYHVESPPLLLLSHFVPTGAIRPRRVYQHHGPICLCIGHDVLFPFVSFLYVALCHAQSDRPMQHWPWTRPCGPGNREWRQQFLDCGFPVRSDPCRRNAPQRSGCRA